MKGGPARAETLPAAKLSAIGRIKYHFRDAISRPDCAATRKKPRLAWAGKRAA